MAAQGVEQKRLAIDVAGEVASQSGCGPRCPETAGAALG
jgi:hypothetical protein